MKINRIFLASAILCGSAVGFSSCDEELDRPPVIEPMATYQPNTTIAELKEAYWQADNNYYTPILTTSKGDSIIIAGRVVSNDAAGNLYRQVIIEDETGAIDFSVTMNDINTKYYYGQEVRVNVTGMIIGKYSGLVRIGAIYNNGIGRMDEAQFTTHAQVNRLPNPALVDTALVTLEDLATYKATTEGLIRWQSRLVRLDRMKFNQGGRTMLGVPGTTSGTSVKLSDESGKTIELRTNNMSTLAGMTAPTGTGSVTAILGYFGSDWQLMLVDAAGLQGFDDTPSINPPNPGGEGDGSSANPFTVDAVTSGAASGTGVWVTGYIVGCIDTSDSNNYQYQFSAPFTGAANLLLAANPDEKILENCVPVQLSNGTTVRNELNLPANPTNHGKQVTIQGNVEKYFNQPGLKTTTSYNWGGTGGTGGGEVEDGQVIYTGLAQSAAECDWTFDNVTMPTELSYIWKWTEYNGNHYLNGSAYLDKVAYAAESYAVSPEIDLTAVTSATASFEHAAKFQTTLTTLCGFAVRESGASDWTPVAIPTWPAAGSWTFVNSGSIDLSAFAGKKIQVGLKYGSSASGADTWEIRNFKVTGK